MDMMAGSEYNCSNMLSGAKEHENQTSSQELPDDEVTANMGWPAMVPGMGTGLEV